jgi:Mg-chelatase subunit ChlD
MIPPLVVAGLGALLVGLALVGLLGLRRSEPRPARLAALAALLALWYAAFDWPIAVRVEQPAEIRLIATGAGSAPGLERLRADSDRRGQPFSVHPASGAGGLVGAWWAAALRAADPRDLALVWDGPFGPAAAPGPDARLRVFTSAPPAAFEPGEVAVRGLATAVVGRPAALEIDLAGGAEDAVGSGAAQLRLRILDPEDRVVREVEVGAGAADGRRALRVDWEPAVAGPHRLELELRGRDLRLASLGAVEVAPAPPPVLVVGAGAAIVVAALAAQGVAATAVEQVPDDLAPADGVLVALGALDAATQERLDAFCDLGGGLLLVGGRGGGALPLAGEALAAASPLSRLPEPAAPDPGQGPGEGSDPAADRSPGRPAEPAAPAGDPPPAPVEGPAKPGDERQPTGDTSAAQRSGVEEDVEVERRGIALVLVVDRSGSMTETVQGTASRMDFAKRSAYETAVQLEDGDELGLIAFGARAYEVLPLGPIPGPAELRSAIEALRATDGQTFVGDAVRRAGAWLIASRAAVRHAVVITDGDRLDPGDLTLAQSAARHMAQAGITVSLIQIASSRYGQAGEIAKIAQIGRGAFVRETDGSQIPRLVFAEVRRALGAVGRRPAGAPGPEAGTGGPGTGAAAATGETPPSERAAEPPPTEPPPTEPQPAAAADPPPGPAPAGGPDAAAPPLRVVALDRSPLLEPQPDGGFPVLFGVSPVVAAPRAQVLLATAEGTPLLAFGHRGLGRIAAFGADWTGPWSAAWREDPLFPARIATWVAAVRPAPAAAGDADLLLGPRLLTPPAPTDAEWRRLRAWNGGPVPAELAALEAGPARVREVPRGRAPDLAFVGLGLLVLLAGIEWRLRTR